MKNKFSKGDSVILKEKFSLNIPSTSSQTGCGICLGGIDIKKGAKGRVDEYLKASNFISSLPERYMVSFPLTKSVNISVMVFASCLKEDDNYL